MKKTTLAATLMAAASIAFASCKWFSSNKSSPSIIGTWRIDSLYPGNDSNAI